MINKDDNELRERIAKVFGDYCYEILAEHNVFNLSDYINQLIDTINEHNKNKED